jgi:hypothetical protein
MNSCKFCFYGEGSRCYYPVTGVADGISSPFPERGTCENFKSSRETLKKCLHALFGPDNPDTDVKS